MGGMFVGAGFVAAEIMAWSCTGCVGCVVRGWLPDKVAMVSSPWERTCTAVEVAGVVLVDGVSSCETVLLMG